MREIAIIGHCSIGHVVAQLMNHMDTKLVVVDHGEVISISEVVEEHNMILSADMLGLEEYKPLAIYKADKVWFNRKNELRRNRRTKPKKSRR